LNKAYNFKSQINGENLANEIENFQINLIKKRINNINESNIILGCTHYEIFQDYFPMNTISLSSYVHQIEYRCKSDEIGEITFSGPKSMAEQFHKFYAITNGFIIATTNQGKLAEIKNKFPLAVSLNQINYYKDVDEPFDTLEENAYTKLIQYSKDIKFNLIVDDSGLFVNQLDGEPGVISSRYSGNNATDESNVAQLINNIDFTKDTSAYFKTVIYARHQNTTYKSQGIIKGHITKFPIGKNGFGYSPIFIPDKSNKTHAQMNNEEKTQFSHRKLALEDLANQIKDKNAS
jgi:XTP/dITP diphosphohydrolase